MRLAILFLLLCPALFAKARPVDLNDFDALAGKTTAYWSFVKQKEDLNTLEYAKELYFKNKDVQFKEEGNFKIPPVVHFIWLGPHPFPPESVENVRTWIAKNPGWRVKFWTDRDREIPCEGMEKILVKNFSFRKLGRCYEESENWGEKSDLLRYEILFREGGVYVDHDANCLKSFSGIHRGYDFYCCLETPHIPFVGRSVTCGNGVLGSRPGHPTVEKVIDLINERWSTLAEKFCGKDEYSKTEVVMQRTYIALTNGVLYSIGKNQNVDIIFPPAYFFAKQGIPSIYSQHFDESTVRKTNVHKREESTLGKIRRSGRNLRYIVMGLVGFNAAVLGLILYKKKAAS